jgi:RNA-directed DNA polymerase
MGYSGIVSSLLASLCTPSPRVYRASEDKWILRKDQFKKDVLPFIPQGASTTPALSNLTCLTLDNELNVIAKINGFRYTRNADDITFSSFTCTTLPKNIRRDVFNCIQHHGLHIHQRRWTYHMVL